MKNKAFLDQAKHNKDACFALLENGNFNDWVITTAYYSSIYYVMYLLFPGQYEIHNKITNFNSFEEYYNRLPNPKDSKHSVREDLVKDNIPEIYTDFSTLKEMCNTARYKQYKWTREEVDLAIACLNAICDECSDLDLAQPAK